MSPALLSPDLSTEPEYELEPPSPGPTPTFSETEPSQQSLKSKKKKKKKAKLAAMRSNPHCSPHSADDWLDMPSSSSPTKGNSSMDSGASSPGAGEVSDASMSRSPSGPVGSLSPMSSPTFSTGSGAGPTGSIDFNKTATFHTSFNVDDGQEVVEVIPTNTSPLAPLSPGMYDMDSPESHHDFGEVHTSAFSPDAMSRALGSSSDAVSPTYSDASKSPSRGDKKSVRVSFSLPDESAPSTPGGGDDEYGDDDFDDYDAEEDARPRVRFAARVVSETRYHDKYSRDEVALLFWGHDDACRFHVEYDRELRKAMMEGKEWNDWILTRTDEDIAREEAEAEAGAMETGYGDDDDDDMDIMDDIEEDLDLSADDGDNVYAF